jgi:small subunit ribosomal protein S8
MVVNDTISDMLTRIRNAHMVKHQIVQIPSTKMSLAITAILKEEGYIQDFEQYSEDNKNYVLISLKYTGKSRQPVICKIERVSKPDYEFIQVRKNCRKFLII